MKAPAEAIDRRRRPKKHLIEMKHIFLAVALMATLGLQPVEAQQRHRHHPKTEQVAPAATATGASAADADEQVAFSDTSSVDTASMVAASNDAEDDVMSNPLSFSHFDNPFAFYVALFSAGFGGIVLALVILLFFCVIFIGPLVLLFMLIRYFINRHDEKVRLRQAALAGGRGRFNPQSIDESQHPYNAYMWSNGVRNASIGLGLVLMFYIWGADALTGVGALVLCLGLGQMLIAWTQRRMQCGTPDDDMLMDDVVDDARNDTAQKGDASVDQAAAGARGQAADKDVNE